MHARTHTGCTALWEKDQRCSHVTCGGREAYRTVGQADTLWQSGCGRRFNWTVDPLDALAGTASGETDEAGRPILRALPDPRYVQMRQWPRAGCDGVCPVFRVPPQPFAPTASSHAAVSDQG